jgi:hypothetical protein
VTSSSRFSRFLPREIAKSPQNRASVANARQNQRKTELWTSGFTGAYLDEVMAYFLGLESEA